jgi:hypothetical protein
MTPAQENLCYSLVTDRSQEPGLRKLLAGRGGEWRQLASVLHDERNQVPGELFVTWLEDPGEPSGTFRLVLFTDTESGEVRSVSVNRARLARE